ncbi:MAG: hypothetical protein ACYCUG_18295 [Acidimicrobiales bacterium]
MADEGMERLVAELDDEKARRILAAAASRHADVGDAVRLAASRRGGDLTALRAMVDARLRTAALLFRRQADQVDLGGANGPRAEPSPSCSGRTRCSFRPRRRLTRTCGGVFTPFGL